MLMAALIFFYGFIVVKSAWICDDAYISLRTVDNFVNGFGLRWNIEERVQSFSNPLWTLLLSGVYLFSHEAFYTTIFFSIFISLIAISVYVFKISKTVYSAIAGVVLACCSKAFIDYSTSGLENPLTYLFIAIFLWVFFSSMKDDTRLFWLCFTASMAAFNRMDSALLFGPAIVYCFIAVPNKKRSIKYALIVLAPFFFWEVFSIIYYGFPFPNTAYAKLNVGVPVSDFIVQGFYYFSDSLRGDPVTLITISVCFILLLFIKDIKSIAAFSGVILYLGYVLMIGGDFMSGRFFAAPFFISVIVLVNISQTFMKMKSSLVVSLLIVSISLLNPTNPLRVDNTYQNRVIDIRGIADERGWYYQGTGLLLSAEERNNPANPSSYWISTGLEYKKSYKEFPVRATNNTGFIGYYSGPKVFIIDHLGLCDPFLARLKPDLDSGWRSGLPVRTGWRIGHFYRHIPEGYIETQVDKKNHIQDPSYAGLYDKLSLIVRGDIFTVNRFVEIWRFNTGWYDSIS